VNLEQASKVKLWTLTRPYSGKADAGKEGTDGYT
jgi:hypothetical protein